MYQTTMDYRNESSCICVSLESIVLYLLCFSHDVELQHLRLARVVLCALRDLSHLK